MACSVFTSFCIILGLLRKKLNFDFVDGLDYHVDNDDEYYEEDEAERNLSQNLMGMPTNKRLRFCLNTSGKDA